MWTETETYRVREKGNTEKGNFFLYNDDNIS